MSIKGRIKTIYYQKIKKYSKSDLRILHLRDVGAHIGSHCYFFSDFLETTEPYLITVGDNVTIASGVRFITHDDSAEYYFPRGSLIVGRINIGNNVFIGAESIIMPGVSVADNCVIGAGSVVTHSITKEGSVVAGVPAKIISNTEELYKKNKKLCLVTTDMSFEEKKAFILDNEEKIKKV